MTAPAAPSSSQVHCEYEPVAIEPSGAVSDASYRHKHSQLDGTPISEFKRPQSASRSRVVNADPIEFDDSGELEHHVAQTQPPAPASQPITSSSASDSSSEIARAMSMLAIQMQQISNQLSSYEQRFEKIERQLGM